MEDIYNYKQEFHNTKDKYTMRKNQYKVVLILAALMLGTKPLDAASLDEVFRSFHTVMGVTNVSLEAYMRPLPGNMDVWRESYLAIDDDVCNQHINNWYLSFVSATVPANADRDGTNSWLYAKSDVIYAVSSESTIKEDTNCWFAIAKEVGAVRAGFRTEHDWEVLMGHDGCERETLPCGVVVIYTTNTVSESEAIWQKVRLMRSDQTTLEHYTDRISTAFDDFKRSQRFRNLSPQEHNSIVSNIVETARFTPREASRYGLTNVVVNTSSD